MELIDLHLSNRVFNTLKKNNINNLEQLLDIRNNRKFRMTPYLEKEITETLEKFNILLIAEIVVLQQGKKFFTKLKLINNNFMLQ